MDPQSTMARIAPRRRFACAMHTAAALAVLAFSPLYAADLTIDDGVVVKFGRDAGLTVRDGLVARGNVTFTSLSDETIAGRTGQAAATAAAGDWRGIRVEPYVLPTQLDLTGALIRFAGGAGGAGLDLRAQNYTLNFLSFRQNLMGLRVVGGSPQLDGVTFAQNAVGLASTDATPRIQGSEFLASTSFGVQNTTPTSVVTATGNWWGAATGPTDPAGNPSGTGDRVTAGVSYGSFAATQPLIQCTLVPASGSYTTNDPAVLLALACRNATEYRLSDSVNFGSTPFTAMTASATYNLPAIPGARTLYAEYRGASGQTRVVATPSPITYTPAVPVVSFVAPAANATITDNVVIEVTATDRGAVRDVAFWVDNQNIATVAQPVAGQPGTYRTTWNIDGFANGTRVLRAVATNTDGRPSEVTRSVNLARPDSVPPSISTLTFNGAALNDGATITAPGSLAATVTDAGGLRSVVVTVDGTNVPGVGQSGTVFSVLLDFDAFANGARTVRVIATDNAGNTTTVARAINLNIAPPSPPSITAPVNNANVGQIVAVSGNAGVGTRMQLYVNGVASGALINTTSAGRFAGSVTLPAEGTFTITADARTSRGTSAAGNAVSVRYTAPAPTVTITAPAEFAIVANDTTITAAISDALPMREVVISAAGRTLATLTSPPWQAAWSIAGLADGQQYSINVRATNTANRTTSVDRTVTVRRAPPPPPPFVAPYITENVTVAPGSSFGNVPVVITGRVRDRTSGAPFGNAALKIMLRINGFQRTISLVGDAPGNFSYAFAPQSTDEGVYQIAVTHPDETNFLSQAAFAINRLSLASSRITVNAARGFAQEFPVGVRASAGDGAVNVRLVARASDQPSGSLPSGISLDLPSGVNLAGTESRNLVVRLNSTDAAPTNGTVILALLSDDSGSVVRGTVRIDYSLFAATPSLQPSRTFIQTGVRQTQVQSETFVLENKGLVAASDVRIELQDSSGGNNVPSWAYLATSSLVGTLEVGGRSTVQFTAAPGNDVSDGVYNLRLRVSAGNQGSFTMPVAVTVTTNAEGSVRFKAVDIFTNTAGADGRLIEGLAGATIRLQNEAVASVTGQGTTDARGDTVIGPLPAGRYRFRASAPNRSDTSGILTIRPGVTSDERVFLDFTAVTVEWSVVETTIEDRYDVTLTATFQTQVPAPVVLMEPLVFNLPDLQVGEVFTGEVNITNYGLLRADNVRFTPPPADAFYRIEFMGQVPSQLESRQRVTLPFKVTAISSLPSTASDSSKRRLDLAAWLSAKPGQKPSADAGKGAKSGTCTSYNTGATLTYDFECAAGDRRSGGASTGFSRVSGGGCGGAGGATQAFGPTRCSIPGCPGSFGDLIALPGQATTGPQCLPENQECDPPGNGPGD